MATIGHNGGPTLAETLAQLVASHGFGEVEAALDAIALKRGRALADDEEQDSDDCAHEWTYTGTAYGGDDERWHGEGRCYCVKCGADGDA